MTEEKSTEKGVSEVHTNNEKEQLEDKKDTPSNVSEDGGEVSNDKAEELDNRTVVDSADGKREGKDGDGTGEEQGKEGDPQNPSNTGNIAHTHHASHEPNTAASNIRKEAVRAAKKVSLHPIGMYNKYIWGSIGHRAHSSQNQLVWVRVGDKGYWVENPARKITEAPLGYPILVDTNKSRRGMGGIILPGNSVIMLEQKKMDWFQIEAARTAAGASEHTDASLAFDDNFSHHYYSSRTPNFMRGRIFLDSDTSKLAILVMEFTNGGKWVKSGKIPINLEVVLPASPLKIGTEVLFTTAVWGNSVVAQRIFPCALISGAETEANTRATLPLATNPQGEREFVSELKSAPTKTMGRHNTELLFRELGKDLEVRVGKEKWTVLEEDKKTPVDILITDSNESDHPNVMWTIPLTQLLIHYQETRLNTQTPLCWEFLKKAAKPELLAKFDQKISETGIGLTVVVETNETVQKIFLEWARSSITSAVTSRRIDTTKAFIDSIGVTCSFGSYVTATNFNEIVSDSFYEVDKTAGIQSIKIFDQKVPAKVSFSTSTAGDINVETDMATRGIVVFALEAVSKKVSAEDRLAIVATEEATAASKFFNNDKEVQIKFRTTTENCRFFDKIKKEYKLQIYYDNNPASRYVGNRPGKGFRTVKCTTVCWSEEQYLGFLNEIHAQKCTDFFVMRIEDMVGGKEGEWTRFTLGTEDFRTGKVLAALKLKLPLMQMMGINGFLTRIAVKGKIELEAIEAAIHSVGKFFPKAIKLLVFNNSIRKYNQQEERTMVSPQNFQPHYSQYVVALAGFPCPLSEPEVVGFLSLANADVTGATFTWYATETEGDFLLQIATSKPEQIAQLREREGGQHDITTFLKWTPELAKSLRYVATLGKPLVIERDPKIVLPPGKSPLSKREIAGIMQEEVVEQEVNDIKGEGWETVNRGGRKRKDQFAPSSSSSSSHAPTSSAAASAADADASSPPGGGNIYKSLPPVPEEEVEEDENVMSEMTRDREVMLQDQHRPPAEESKKTAARGTVKNFKTITTAIVDKIMHAETKFSRGVCRDRVEDIQRNYYDLNYNSEQVFEEMERLAGQEVSDIILEIMSPMEDTPTPQKRKCPDGRPQHAERENPEVVEDSGEEMGGDDSLNPSEDHHSRAKRPNSVADPATGQQSLTSMWGLQTTTSQKTNEVQDGEEQ